MLIDFSSRINIKSSFGTYNVSGNFNFWMSPDGKVSWTWFTKHAEKARQIIEENGWDKEMDNSRFKGCSMDFLHHLKGYLRFESHCQKLIYTIDQVTPKQKRKLFELCKVHFDDVKSNRF